MGQIYLDNELLVNQPEEFFVALREALNNLWDESIMQICDEVNQCENQ